MWNFSCQYKYNSFDAIEFEIRDSIKVYVPSMKRTYINLMQFILVAYLLGEYIYARKLMGY